MEIKINGKPADITLEAEKTVVEVLAGIDQWLSGSGLLVSGLELDGKSYGSLSLDKALKLPLEGVSTMDIKTSGWPELLLEALTGLENDFSVYEAASAEERQNYREHWEQSSPALFLKDHDAALYQTLQKILENASLGGKETSLSVSAAIALIAERIREIEDPSKETKAMHPAAEEIAKRLEDMPLDMQTGKDARASETIAAFSSLVEKIFRLIFLFKYFGTDIESIEVSSMAGPGKVKFRNYISEFSAVLKESISAYETRDTVLLGDLAEYELAPRLRNLAAVLCGVKTGEKS